MAYSSNYEGKQVDEAVKDVLNHDVIVKYGNIEGTLQNQTDLALELGSKLPLNHVTDDEILPDSAEGDIIPTVPTSKAIRTYIQGRIGNYANKDLNNLSQAGKDKISYKPGVGIKIDEKTRTITNEYPATWGGITGYISNQTDLQQAFGYSFKEGDSIQDNLDKKQDISTSVTHTYKTAIGNSSTPVYVDSSGSAKACARPIPFSSNSVVEGSTEVLTSGGAYANLVRREDPSSAIGSPSQPVYVDETGKVVSCLPSTSSVSDIVSRTPSSVSGAGVIALLEMIYPVGAIYIGTTVNCPLAAIFGTWTKVAEDRALQGSSSTRSAGTLVEPYAKITVPCTEWGVSGGYPGSVTQGRLIVGSGNWEIVETLESLKAAGSDKVIESNSVQTPAYVVNIWRRVS